MCVLTVYVYDQRTFSRAQTAVAAPLVRADAQQEHLTRYIHMVSSDENFGARRHRRPKARTTEAPLLRTYRRCATVASLSFFRHATLMEHSAAAGAGADEPPRDALTVLPLALPPELVVHIWGLRKKKKSLLACAAGLRFVAPRAPRRFR